MNYILALQSHFKLLTDLTTIISKYFKQFNNNSCYIFDYQHVNVMNRDKIRLEAKEKIQQIFESINELEHSAKSFSKSQKEIWKNDLNNLEKSKETVKSLYDSLLEESEESFDYLNSAFNQMSDVMSKRLNGIKENIKEKVEAR
ncbi:MAG: hypothetical protein CMB80_24970 [Flammeovirgaceae bacterium]|nr:hypothetical protein [Flammeovirgaceae bacterium]HCX21895.1 hypothetical protein [Cytophagales bacterium]